MPASVAAKLVVWNIWVVSGAAIVATSPARRSTTDTVAPGEVSREEKESYGYEPLMGTCTWYEQRADMISGISTTASGYAPAVSVETPDRHYLMGRSQGWPKS